MMNWSDVFSQFEMKEGEIISYATQDGIYIGAEIVKVICPLCLEEFIGNKRMAGGFISGHQIYHQFVDERADYYGGI